MTQQKKKNIIVQSHIDGITHDGRGIAHLDGKSTFVFGALPNEEVSFRYTRRHGQFDEGHITEVLTPAPERTEPFCPYFGTCGGCQLQHAQHSHQISLKKDILKELLTHHIGTIPSEIEHNVAPPTHYRRKARLSVKYLAKTNEMLIGFREHQGRYIARIHSCPILDHRIADQIPLLKETLLQLEARHKIPQIEVAAGDNALAIIVRHLIPLSSADQNLLLELARSQGWWLYCQPKGIDTIHRLHPPPDDQQLHYEIDQDLTLHFQPEHFIQNNIATNRYMVEQVLHLLDPQPSEHILDLFCGIGNFSLPLARRAGRITGVEGDAAAVKQAMANAAHYDYEIDFAVANLLETPQASWSQHLFHKMLIDPPRSGLSPELIEWIIGKAPSHIVYISCNPVTLARDLKSLTENGYHLKVVRMADMFPHTKHIETIVLCTKKKKGKQG